MAFPEEVNVGVFFSHSTYQVLEASFDGFTVEKLKPKYPVKVKTPTTVAYEYYTPANRVESRPTELTVTEK